MDDVSLYLRSIGLGVAVAAPVGPMALLCMRRTLVKGWAHGVATGFGIAVGDGLYALVAAWGLASICSFMLSHQKPLHAAAGLFLLYLGIKTFSARPAEEKNDAQAGQRLYASWPGAFSGAVLLTLTNPPTIIMFAAIFAALAPRSGFHSMTALVTVVGVFTGSLLWWCAVAAVVSALRGAIGPTARRWIDRVAGTALAAFGLAEIRKAI